MLFLSASPPSSSSGPCTRINLTKLFFLHITLLHLKNTHTPLPQSFSSRIKIQCPPGIATKVLKSSFPSSRLTMFLNHVLKHLDTLLCPQSSGHFLNISTSRPFVCLHSPLCHKHTKIGRNPFLLTTRFPPPPAKNETFHILTAVA